MSLTAGPRGRNTGHGAARERACVRATSEARSPSPARCPEPSGRTRRHNDRYARHRTHQPRAEEGHRGHAQPGAPRPRSPLRLRTSGPLGGWFTAPLPPHSSTRSLGNWFRRVRCIQSSEEHPKMILTWPEPFLLSPCWTSAKGPAGRAHSAHGLSGHTSEMENSVYAHKNKDSMHAYPRKLHRITYNLMDSDTEIILKYKITMLFN